MSRNILVVGGSRGIGLSVVKRLINKGDTVYVMSRSTGELGDLSIEQHIKLDIVNDDFDKSALPDQLDGLVYCPGSIELKPFRSLKIDQFKDDMAINFYGAVKAIQGSLSLMKKSDRLPSVVLYSTVAVGQGMPFHASIASAKGAIEGLVRSLAAELAPSIRVNGIAPSLVDTDLSSKILSSEDRKEASNQRHPLRRYGDVDDISAATLFLLSDESSWVSGQILGVDGGLSRLRV